jgi:hypothetical protein
MMFPGIDEELQAILGKKLLTSVLDEQWEKKRISLGKLCSEEKIEVGQ